MSNFYSFLDDCPLICVIPSKHNVAYGPFTNEQAIAFLDRFAQYGFVAIPLTQPAKVTT